MATLLFDSIPPHVSSSPPTAYLSSPSPPNPPSPTNPNELAGKRRKHESPSPSSSEWKPYLFGAHTYPVHDLITLAPISDLLDVTIQKTGANFSETAVDDTWICYRQNQFKVIILFQCPQAPASMCVNDGTGMTHQVTGVCARLYAVSEMDGVTRDAMRVGLHHAGKGRRKSNKQVLETVPFERGKIELNNLQFEKSNVVHKKQLEFYHLIVSVYARCENAEYHIFSRISPKIIVRGQHPGYYDDSGVSSKNTSSSSQPPTSCTIPTPHPSNNGTDVQTTNLQTTNLQDVNYATVMSHHDGADVNSTPYQNTKSESDTPYHHDESTNAMMTCDVIETNAQLTSLEMDATSGEVPNIMTHFGKMGINTNDPKEALSVHGNIMMTGYLYKPSDYRIKSDIREVDNVTQLNRMRQLKIYDYQVHANKERGVLAQELAIIMPEAVHTAGDVQFGSATVPNLLVVNERSLLYENIGATQALDASLASEKSNIVNIDERVANLAGETEEQKQHTRSYMQAVLDVFFLEEKKMGKTSYEGLEEEYITFAFSIFRMGPARSLLVLGNIAIWAWAIGCVYIFSNIRDRRILGFSCLVSFAALTIITELYRMGIVEYSVVWNHQLSNACSGLVLLIANYIRMRKQLKKEGDHRKNLLRELNLISEEKKKERKKISRKAWWAKRCKNFFYFHIFGR